MTVKVIRQKKEVEYFVPSGSKIFWKIQFPRDMGAPDPHYITWTIKCIKYQLRKEPDTGNSYKDTSPCHDIIFLRHSKIIMRVSVAMEIFSNEFEKGI